MPNDRWSITEIRILWDSLDEENVEVVRLGNLDLTPGEVRAFAGELLDAAVRVERAAKEEERG